MTDSSQSFGFGSFIEAVAGPTSTQAIVTRTDHEVLIKVDLECTSAAFEPANSSGQNVPQIKTNACQSPASSHGGREVVQPLIKARPFSV